MNFIRNILKSRVKDLNNLLKKGDILIDCGANIGQETIPAAKKGAEVYSFEPNPYAFAQLKKSVGDMNNVHLYNQGVLDRNSSMKLFMHDLSDEDEVKWSVGSSLMAEKKNVKQDKFMEVEIIDLTEFIMKLNKHIKVLKIDVEGVEFEILNKLIDSGIYKDIDFILAETHEKKIPELQPKLDALNKKIEEENITNINLNWI